MKRKLLGIAAIAIAVAASAFTVPTSTKASGKLTSFMWFKISGTHAPGAAIPQADAVYLGTGATPPAQPNCSSSLPNQCVSGFNSNQVNPSTDQLIGTQSPASPGTTRN